MSLNVKQHLQHSNRCSSSSLQIHYSGSAFQEASQDGVRCARYGRLGVECLRRNIQKEPEEAGRTIDCKTADIWQRERRKEWGIGRVFNCSARLRKFPRSQWRVLDLKSPIREALCLPGTRCFRFPAALSHRLGWAGGDQRHLLCELCRLHDCCPQSQQP